MDEWRLKCEDLSCELDSSQRECRNCSSELFRLRAAWDETVEQLDTVRRENKNLADEIKDLLDQLGEGGRSIHELDKQRRRLQVSFFLQKIIFSYRSNGQQALEICLLVKVADIFMNWTSSIVACK